MCGRFTQTSDAATLAQRFRAVVARGPAVEPRYNIAPTDFVPVVVLSSAQERFLAQFRWGLLPAWARSLKDRPQPINAKAETLAASGMFRRLLPAQRCLVLADSFFEWTGPKSARRPMRICLRSRAPFAFAGLWDAWQDPEKGDAPALRSCTIVTVAANSLVAPLHDRMPAILRPDDEERWLDPALREPANLAPLLRPYDARELETYPVSEQVNSVRCQGPECIAPRSPVGDG
ncbi:MAG: SOS response-associated peptidase [Deltaproteobacteria bacterium]|nr:SOS response-associated peptidase [Deltaproteobacteria bacterium]